jgi:hypothetical protein
MKGVVFVREDNGKIKFVSNNSPSKNDPDGSYTGVPLKKGENPVQDADDL